MSSQFGETNPGSVHQSFGGVGRNIAGMGFYFFFIVFFICLLFYQEFILSVL